MKQYKKIYELKNAAKDKLDGKYRGAILIMFLASLISFAASLIINMIASATVNSVYLLSGSTTSANTIKFVFDLIMLAANILLSVMNAGITLYFLNAACGMPYSIGNLFYGFTNDSKKVLIITTALVLCQTICLRPYQYLSEKYLNTMDDKWLIYTLIAFVIGLCAYVPISLGIALSYYLMFDFPEKSAKEILALCWQLMRGQRKRLLCLEFSFFPLMLLCILTFGIGYLWLNPYMQMTYTQFFLDMMNPKETE